jgi:hypothetical protein
MTMQSPSALLRQGNRMWAGRSFACRQRVAVRGLLCRLGPATEIPWRGPLTRHLRESAQIAASPKPREPRSAHKGDCPAKAGEGAAR